MLRKRTQAEFAVFCRIPLRTYQRWVRRGNGSQADSPSVESNDTDIEN